MSKEDGRNIFAAHIQSMLTDMTPALGYLIPYYTIRQHDSILVRKSKSDRVQIGVLENEIYISLIHGLNIGRAYDKLIPKKFDQEALDTTRMEIIAKTARVFGLDVEEFSNKIIEMAETRIRLSASLNESHAVQQASPNQLSL